MRLRRGVSLLLYLAAFCVLSVPTSAQVQTGEIFGRVADESGAVVPGATVTLESPALIKPLTTIATSTGAYSFPRIPVGIYAVGFEMAGFARLVREGVRADAGFNAEVNARLKVSAMKETMTVTGEGPVVDTKSTTLASNFTREILEKIPSARDPWVILEQTPGIVMDRQNVGGNQSGQQSGYLAHGSGENSTWNVDGSTITDMAATGSSPTYYDFDSFEEIQITTGGADASQDAGGVAINFVTKSGGNSFRGSGRFFLTNKALESDNVTSALRAQGAGSGNPIKDIRDYGFEVGGPIKKNKAWFWGGYGRNDIRVGVVGFLKSSCTDADNIDCLETDLTVLENYNAKLNYQWAKSHKSTLQFQRGDKIRNARGAGPLRPIETTVRQSGPSNFFYLQHQWFAANNLMLEAKGTYADAGFLLDFHSDELADVQPTFDIVTQMEGRSGSLSNNIRPTKEARIDGTYFFSALGGDHSTKFGARGRWTPYETISKTGGGAVARFRNGVPAEANIVRNGHTSRDLYEYSAYFNDSYRKGRLTVNLGLRYDYQKDKALTANIKANPILPDLLPSVDFKGADSGAHYGDLAPRFGVTYDVRGNGKTVLKGTAARYYGIGIFTAGNLSPTGSTTLRYPWNDSNGDRFVQRNELDLRTLLSFSSNYDPNNPASVQSPISVDPRLANDVTNEFLAGIEHELMKGFGVSLSYIWRHYYNYTSTFRIGLKSSDYRPVNLSAACGNGSCDQPSYTVTYWQLPFQIPSNSIQRNHLDGRRYQGLELVAKKRYNGKWMLNGSITYNNTIRRYEGGPDVDYHDPTNVAQQEGYQVGTSNVRWVAKLTGLYSLPAGFQVSAFLNTRQGFPFNRQVLTPTRTGGIGTANVFVKPYATERYPTFKEVDAALEKTFGFGKTKLTASVAGFNLVNSNVVLGRIARQNASNANNVTTILAPRVFRVGLRMSF